MKLIIIAGPSRLCIIDNVKVIEAQGNVVLADNVELTKFDSAYAAHEAVEQFVSWLQKQPELGSSGRFDLHSIALRSFGVSPAGPLPSVLPARKGVGL